MAKRRYDSPYRRFDKYLNEHAERTEHSAKRKVRKMEIDLGRVPELAWSSFTSTPKDSAARRPTAEDLEPRAMSQKRLEINAGDVAFFFGSEYSDPARIAAGCSASSSCAVPEPSSEPGHVHALKAAERCEREAAPPLQRPRMRRATPNAPTTHAHGFHDSLDANACRALYAHLDVPAGFEPT
jgi:hypothetical protein